MARRLQACLLMSAPVPAVLAGLAQERSVVAGRAGSGCLGAWVVAAVSGAAAGEGVAGTAGAALVPVDCAGGWGGGSGLRPARISCSASSPPTSTIFSSVPLTALSL